MHCCLQQERKGLGRPPFFARIYEFAMDTNSPLHDKRVREAVSLAINRQFLTKQESQGIGIP